MFRNLILEILALEKLYKLRLSANFYPGRWCAPSCFKVVIDLIGAQADTSAPFDVRIGDY